MSAWRSPLLFLGVLLIAIAGAALLAPLFIDWNTYRAEFEEYGRKVTGRDVAIAGPIEARLFPWPALVLNQVTIANPNGARRAHFMDAGRIEMGMSLAPLISGKFEVDTIAIDSPVFAFERLASGAASFAIDLDRSLPALIEPDRVLISEISISNGTVLAADHRRDGMMRLDALTGTLSAPALSGPWRLSATASHAGSPFEINLSTGKLMTGEPARLAMRIGPMADEPGMVFSFDGEVARPQGERGAGKSLKGAIRIAPSPSSREKGDAEGGFPRFEAKADIEADFDSVALSEIEASPAFSTDPGNFITGAAGIDLGSRIVIDAALSTARIDLDQLAGRHRGAPRLSAETFEELGLVLARLPDTMELHVDLAATSVIADGATHEASRLKFALDRERLRIEELTTALPGQTRTSFSGLMVFGDGAPLLSGDVSLESVSLRDFVVWAIPDQRRAVEKMWNGVRGRFKLDAKIDVTANSLRLSEVAANLDEAPLTGSLTAQGGSDRGLALRIDAERLDLDRYLPRGFEGWSGPGISDKGLARTLSDLAAGAMGLGDFQLSVQAGELKFHGVEARDIAIDLGADENVVEIRTMEIGQVESARMDVSGVLSFPGEGVAGALNAVIDAEDPRALMRLLGVIGPEVALEPDWAAALGPLDVRMIAEAGAEDGLTTASLALSGTAGGAVATLEGTFRGEPASWRDAEIELAGVLDAKSSALPAAVTGLRLDQPTDRPTRLAGSLAGSLGKGLATTLEAELLGASGQFIGTLKEGRRTVEAQGRVAVLAENAAELLAIAGVPEGSLDSGARVLAAESEVVYDGRGLRFSTLSGTAAGSAFTADVNFVFEPVRRVSGKVATESLSLPWLLGAILLPRDGKPHALSSHFASAVPALEADLTIAAERLDVLPHIAFESSEVVLKVGRYDVLLSGHGSGPGGEPATGRIAIELDSRGVAMEGALTGPVELGALLQAGGSPVIEAAGEVELAFSGHGRSPAGVLAALEAEGSYELAQGVLRRVDPDRFARDLAAAKQPSEIDGLFTGSLRGGDMSFVGGRGSLAFTDGVLQAKPLAILGGGLTGEARFVLEAASGDVDLSFTLGLADRHNIPAFELAFAGPPQALEPSTDAQNLKSYLSMQMLQQSVEQLEELQRQEEALIEEEEQFQREQEERERQRLEQERRDARMKLDRKELEAAARLLAEQQQAEKLQIEQRKADRQALELLTKPAVAPEGVEAVQQASEPEPQPDQRPAAPAADRLSALPLQEPQELPPDIESAAAAPGDPVPVPRLKPEHEPDRAALEPARKSVQLPPDGNLGRIPEPVFSGPSVLQPHLSPTPPGQGLR